MRTSRSIPKHREGDSRQGVATGTIGQSLRRYGSLRSPVAKPHRSDPSSSIPPAVVSDLLVSKLDQLALNEFTVARHLD